jgi:hypothetical protein
MSAQINRAQGVMASSLPLPPDLFDLLGSSQLPSDAINSPENPRTSDMSISCKADGDSLLQQKINSVWCIIIELKTVR